MSIERFAAVHGLELKHTFAFDDVRLELTKAALTGMVASGQWMTGNAKRVVAIADEVLRELGRDAERDDG